MLHMEKYSQFRRMTPKTKEKVPAQISHTTNLCWMLFITFSHFIFNMFVARNSLSLAFRYECDFHEHLGQLSNDITDDHDNNNISILYLYMYVYVHAHNQLNKCRIRKIVFVLFIDKQKNNIHYKCTMWYTLWRYFVLLLLPDHSRSLDK